jgi:protein-arginine kinase activator protein McsA
MLNANSLKKLVRAVLHTREQELTCQECFDQLDQFVELQLDGKQPAEAMPLVQEHLETCGNCRDTFEALVLVLEKNPSP